MPLSMSESKAVNDLAGLLYGFLPGTPHPYGNQSISFAGVARDLGLAKFWPGGSKRPALVSLLGKTLELYRGQFCGLILEIIRRGMTYRTQHGEPITREEIKQLNQVILQVKFKIPELWDPVFLNSLPSQEVNSGEKSGGKDKVDLEKLKQQFTNLLKLKPQARGFEFERFLQDLFDAFGLAPRSSFRLVGEQIDGSFQLEGDTYLVEAKWQDQLVGNAELLIFQGKVEGKSAWARGLLISYGGFSEDGLIAFSRGRPTNIIAMTGSDLYFILDGKMSLSDALRMKARRAAETGQTLVTVQELSLGM